MTAVGHRQNTLLFYPKVLSPIRSKCECQYFMLILTGKSRDDVLGKGWNPTQSWNSNVLSDQGLCRNCKPSDGLYTGRTIGCCKTPVSCQRKHAHHTQLSPRIGWCCEITITFELRCMRPGCPSNRVYETIAEHTLTLRISDFHRMKSL